jgi:MoaA/NifB/PqqE/SkfB family radical SAM enzyme
MLLSLLKSVLPSSVKAGLLHWLGVGSTQWNYRLHQRRERNRWDQFRDSPRRLHIEGTNICNAKCVFCAYPQMQRAKQTMPMELFQKAVQQYVDMGGTSLALTPIVGDPFVDPFFFQRLEWLDENTPIDRIVFYTNAILMKPEAGERLLRYADKLDVNISWGGFCQETYRRIMGVDAFHQVSRHTEYLIRRKNETGSQLPINLALRCPDSDLQGSSYEKYRRWVEEGAITWKQLLDYDSWAGTIDPEELLAVGLRPKRMPHKRGPCELLFSNPVVLADGRVNACACRDAEAELVIGDVNDRPLADIYREGAKSLIDRHERGDFPDVCKRCTYYVSIYDRRRGKSPDDKADAA